MRRHDRKSYGGNLRGLLNTYDSAPGEPLFRLPVVTPATYFVPRPAGSC